MADNTPSFDGLIVEPPQAIPLQAAAPTVSAAATSVPAISATAIPAAAAGNIVFRCSNGHRIVAPATMAGQRGKCSKCGVLIPMIPGKSEPRSEPRVAPPRAAGGGLASRAAAATAEPRAAGGKSGQPIAAEAPGPVTVSERPTTAAEPPQAGGQPGSRVDIFAGLAELSDSQAPSSGVIEELEVAGSWAQDQPSIHQSSPVLQSMGIIEEPSQPAAAFQPNPTAALMARLFEEVQHGGVVEVHVSGGSVILPEFYEAHWSTGTHGLFASRAADGTVTLTAVAWDSILKIIVRQVNGLPDGMFE